MTNLFDRLFALLSGWKPWVVVPPWAVGVRVRLGRNATRLDPGPHLRIPGLDAVTMVNTRLRTVCTWEVTRECEPLGWTRTRQVALGYRIVDPVAAMLSYDNAGTALMMLATAAVSEIDNLDDVLACVRRDTEGRGIELEFVRPVLDVRIQGIRLLNQIYSHNSSSEPVDGPNGARY